MTNTKINLLIALATNIPFCDKIIQNLRFYEANAKNENERIKYKNAIRLVEAKKNAYFDDQLMEAQKAWVGEL